MVRTTRVKIRVEIKFQVPTPSTRMLTPELHLLDDVDSTQATQVTFASFNVMLKNCVAPRHVGAAIGYGSAAGTCGFALGPLWGGSLFAASSAPGALGVLGKGRMFFIVLATLAAANSQLARPRVPSSAPRCRREPSTHRPSRCRRGPRTRAPGATCSAAGRARCRTSARAGRSSTDFVYSFCVHKTLHSDIDHGRVAPAAPEQGVSTDIARERRRDDPTGAHARHVVQMRLRQLDAPQFHAVGFRRPDVIT